MKQQKVVIIGGPSTGKSTIIEELTKRGYDCMPEISREIIAKAQKEGIEQLFLTDPLLFSDLLLKGRIEQHEKATEKNTPLVFFDRGIPDVQAYLDYKGESYPKRFEENGHLYRYTTIFILPPWEEIHETDGERYENFEQSKEIHQYLKQTYENIGYTCIEVPLGTVQERTDFILEHL
ncbi:MAG: ATP-binding protein [Flavobacteriaceae bacterium]|nr:ATP-binding protein [Flavobacteriaceae bacterium]